MSLFRNTISSNSNCVIIYLNESIDSKNNKKNFKIIKTRSPRQDFFIFKNLTVLIVTQSL